jgi:hypothetical protein
MRIVLSVDSGGGITWELDGNQLGTSTGQVVPTTPSPLKGEGSGTSPNPATANIYGLTDAELLDCLGPSWAAMDAEERRTYPRPVWQRFVVRNAA